MAFGHEILILQNTNINVNTASLYTFIYGVPIVFNYAPLLVTFVEYVEYLNLKGYSITKNMKYYYLYIYDENYL